MLVIKIVMVKYQHMIDLALI